MLYILTLIDTQDCYPERLGKLFLLHAPRIFMAVWKIIYPFIDDNTKTKVSFQFIILSYGIDLHL